MRYHTTKHVSRVVSIRQDILVVLLNALMQWLVRFLHWYTHKITSARRSAFEMCMHVRLAAVSYSEHTSQYMRPIEGGVRISIHHLTSP